MGILQSLCESRRWQDLDDWRMLADGFQMPPLDFYDRLETALKKERQIPELELSREQYRESNLLSDRRVYLRLRRGQLLFDCCAAPFGTGFLFSYWLWLPPRALTLHHILGLLLTLGGLDFLVVDTWGLFNGLVVLTIGLLALFGVLRAARIERIKKPLEDFLHGISVIGVLYELFFRRPTYFEMDTAYAFLDSVRRSYLGVLDGLAESHGLRTLTDEERKPAMRDFFKK